MKKFQNLIVIICLGLLFVLQLATDNLFYKFIITCLILLWVCYSNRGYLRKIGIKKISIVVMSIAAFLLFMGSAIMYAHKHKHAKIKEAYIDSLEQQQITD